MSRIDLTYTSDGFMVTFFAETDAGREAWNELAKHSEGTGKFPAYQLPSIKNQMRTAGLTFRRVRPASVSKTDVERLAKALAE